MYIPTWDTLHNSTKVVNSLQSQTDLNQKYHYDFLRQIVICTQKCFWKAIFMMQSYLKEKSWSVLLEHGYILDGQVRAERCEKCKSTTEILISNFNNPNLLLFGCKDSKCRHKLLRLNFEQIRTPQLGESIFDKRHD